ncbi:MAG TPA: glycosyltransferase, partial [Rhodothermales bacterium]
MDLISVAILTKNGGHAFEEVLRALSRQVCPIPHEVVILDSGSRDGTLDAAKAAGAHIHQIRPSEFSFGESRDLLFSKCNGDVIATISQDALPEGDRWLDALTEPLRNGEADVVQGHEKMDDKTFYWDRIGSFYISSEWRPFLEQYGSPGLSTVNLAVSRSAWEKTGFGPISMCSDKLFQKRVAECGLRVAVRRDAVVHHGHHYDVGSLTRRCANEGMALRQLGYAIDLRQTAKDLIRLRSYRKLASGLLRGEVRSVAELLFPVLRPAPVWYGNHNLSGYWR